MKILIWVAAWVGVLGTSLSQASSGGPQTIRVCPSCVETSIRKAIDGARAGAVIQVSSGTYQEEAIVIQKSIKLMGEDTGAGLPVIDGQKKVAPITIIKTDQVEISGFVIKDTGSSYVEDVAAIKVIDSKNCLIRHNRFENTTFGIYLQRAVDCTLDDNELRGQAKDESSGGNGIHIWSGSGHTVDNNRVSGHRDGIYLEFVSHAKILRNDVRKNLRYGLHFMQSSDADYFSNYFSENGSGVAVMYSKKIQMRDNHFVLSSGQSSYGLLLKEIHDSVIENNEFSQNTVAIFMEGSNRSKFRSNRVVGSGWALRIMGDCEGNEFEKNDFIQNAFDVTTNSSQSANLFKGNYWSHYSGYDLDRNGVGDVPYRPVSLSSVVLEQIDSSYVLLNSFLFSVLDQVERALPSMTPEPLKDEEPAMAQFGAGVRK